MLIAALNLNEERMTCEGAVRTPQLFDPSRRANPGQCLRRAEYRIDGHCYCWSHAGEKALAFLIAQETGVTKRR